MSKNKNVSFKRNFVEDYGRRNTSALVFKVQKGTWPNILADICYLPDKFEDSIILYIKEDIFIFTNVSLTFAKELDTCTKGEYQSLTLESIGTWSHIYETFLIYKDKGKRLSIFPKNHKTIPVFEQLENKLSAITVYVKIADLFSEDNSVHKTDLNNTDKKYFQPTTFLTEKDSKKTGKNNCPSGQISLKRLRKVISPTPVLSIALCAEPFTKEEPMNQNFPQQVSEEQSSSERSEFAFSSGMSLPFATDQASSLAVGNESVSEHYRQRNNTSILQPPRYPDYAEYNERLGSYATWTHINPDAITLSKAGFFYTNNGDLVRCYQCGIGLKDFSGGDDPLKEHVRHSGRCLFLIKLVGEARLMEWKRQLQFQDPEYNRQMQLSGQRSATSSYRHPEYQTVEARLETFTNWPTQMMQTPMQLAEAGLYYTGFEDNVRCFACDGGLRRWDPDDDPWTEHCRWFPACPYAKETKGDEFIALVQAAVAFENEETETSSSHSRDQDLLGAMEQMTLRDPEFRAALNEHKDTCLEMGYQLTDFNEAVQELRNRGTIKPTIEEILDVIEVIKAREQQDSMLQARQNETPIEENQRLKSLIICMSCGRNTVNTLFLPCTHHRLCMECAEPLKHCPVCERYIRQKIRTYLV